jgi:hypothetical protein
VGQKSRSKQQRHKLTRFKLLAEMLSLATGEPAENFERNLADLQAANRVIDAPLAPEVYEQLRAEMLADLPAVEKWLRDGAAKARNDPDFLDEVREVRRIAASRN